MSGAVIIGYDQTLAGERALALAADEAALRGVPLQIVNIVRPGDGRRPTEAANALAEWIVEEGERTAHEAHPELLVEKHVAVGRPDEVLTDEAHAAEMLVLGDRSHRDFAALREDAVTVHALDRATCPVLVLSPDDHRPRHRITVAVGMNGPVDELLGFSFEEAARHRAALRVVNVHASRPNVGRKAFDAEEIRSGATLVVEDEDALEKAVAAWRARYPEVETDVEVRSGSIDQVLVEATCDGDLLVVGGRRRDGGRPGMEIGPAVHTLLHYAECPVAVVPIG
jgi:nucleotide-binding universal stress UspA family protein